MVRKSKGISLVSLIIVIVSIIILIGVVVGVGYNYIQETNKTEGTTVVKLISDAAYNRQNDKHLDENMYYVGYPLKPDSISNLTGVPEDFAVEVNEIWYFIDAKSAEELGVKESDKFIEKDLMNPKEEIAKTVLVDYTSGEAYLVEIRTEFIDGSIVGGNCSLSPNGSHVYSIQTCTLGSACIFCGSAQTGHENGLGHNFTPATCTAAGTCSRCGAVNASAPAKGHSFKIDDVTGDEAWLTDATRHWKECEVCGAKKDTDEHIKGYVRIKLSDSPETYDAKYHKELCSVCAWESVRTPHSVAYKVTGDYTHDRYCESCEYVEEHIDSGWIMTDPTHHWRECDETCETADGSVDCTNVEKMFYEEHFDNNNDGTCDTCLRTLDDTPPSSFDSVGSYARVDLATTSTLDLSAFTTDDLSGAGVRGYYFGVDYKDGNGIVWDEMIEANGVPATTKYVDLLHNTQYDIYVKAVDSGNNATPAYKIPNTVTVEVPLVKGINGVPSGYVKDPFVVEFQNLNTALPNLTTEYSLDGGITWKEETEEILVNTENFELRARVKDNRLPTPNRGDIWGPITITNLDLTEPTISIEPKDGDTPTALQTSHKAVIIVTDEKYGITPGTTVQYAWSTSNKNKPTTYSIATTKNSETTSSATAEVTTPEGVTGEYYVWVNAGVKDGLGNATKEAVCSPVKYNVDDQEASVGSIRMFNATPEVEGMTGFVKTNSIITVSFIASKALGEAPEVYVAGERVTDIVSSDKVNWTATIPVNTSMPEGEISLRISNIKTLAGKDSNKTYTDSDLIEGPVIYDNTLPTMESVDK